MGVLLPDPEPRQLSDPDPEPSQRVRLRLQPIKAGSISEFFLQNQNL